MSGKTKTIYLLRIRENDQSEWGEPANYPTRRERDQVAAQCRAWGGLRTWSYDEKIEREPVSPQQEATNAR